MRLHNSCSRAKYMKRRFVITALIVALSFGALFLLKYHPSASQFIWQMTQGGERLWILVSIAALLDSVNPCAFSILLLTLAFLFSLGALSRVRVLQVGGAYIGGIFVAYVSIGLGILQALHLFNTPRFMGKFGAFLLVVLGLISLANHFFPQFPIRLKIPDAAHSKIADLLHKGTIPAAFALGLLVGLCEFPCTGGPYLMVLGLLHDAQTRIRGLWYLLWYNLLFVLPLIVILIFASQKAVLEKLQEWKRTQLGRVHLIAGIIMILLGIAIFVL